MSWFFTLLSWAVGREERSTVCCYQLGNVWDVVEGSIWRNVLESAVGAYWFEVGIEWLMPCCC